MAIYINSLGYLLHFVERQINNILKLKLKNMYFIKMYTHPDKMINSRHVIFRGLP